MSRYGVVGLKTHCKVILVVRQDYDGLRRYVHIGTGNYHPDTARIYSDFGLFTVRRRRIGQDVTELFNYLTTGYGPRRKYRKLLLGAALLKPALLERIEREIGAQAAEGGLIQFKMNALEDADIIRALYRAVAGGRADRPVVRDTCRLRPGLPGPVGDDPRGQHRRALPRARARSTTSATAATRSTSSARPTA